jgi:hypothetical protein
VIRDKRQERFGFAARSNPRKTLQLHAQSHFVERSHVRFLKLLKVGEWLN